MAKKTKEFIVNSVGFGLMHVDIDPDFHDTLMSKIDAWFWPLFMFVMLGTLSYLI